MRTEPSPAATCESEPAPAMIRYLAAKRAASSLNEPIATRGLKTSIASTSSRIAQQVLVVGDRVHAVERVRHVDEAALALDLGDRLCRVSPRGIFSLDEQPDHLALVGGLDLLGDDHLDAPSALRGRASSAPGDLVVVGDRDRARGPARARSPAAPRRASRSRASGRCACAGRRRSAAVARAARAAPRRRRCSWRRAATAS